MFLNKRLQSGVQKNYVEPSQRETKIVTAYGYFF